MADQKDHSRPNPTAENSSSHNGDDVESESAKEALEDDNHEYVTGVKLIMILMPTTLVYFLLMLDGSIISTAIPEITSEFDSLLDVGWYVFTLSIYFQSSETN